MSSEVTDRDIQAEVERIRAEEAAVVRETARSRAKTAAELRAEEERKEEEATAAARAENAKKRKAAVKKFATSIANYMVETETISPYSIPGTVVNRLMKEAGV